MDVVVTTRHLLEGSLQENRMKRFVNISSFSVYANTHTSWSRLLDESSPVETHAHLRGEAYCFAKTKQDEIVEEYGNKFGIPYVTVRPGYVYGPGNTTIPSRVGIDTFGVFLHLGGSNSVPLTYIDNCVEAIALAGLKMGVKNEVFNIVDDDLPSSRTFLRLYKQNFVHFTSFYVPHFMSYAFFSLCDLYSAYAKGQFPPPFNPT